MLFRPLYPVKIGKFNVPFTPGVIPKRKNDIGAALGKVVSKSLFTKEDASKLLVSENIKSSVADGIINEVFSSDTTIKELGINILSDSYDDVIEKLTKNISNTVKDSIKHSSAGYEMALDTSNLIESSFGEGIISSVVNSKLIESVTNPISSLISNYITSKGEILITPEVEKEVAIIENSCVSDIINSIGFDKKVLKLRIEELYEKLINDKIDLIIDNFDIESVVKEKVDTMDVKDIENLVFDVMKKEFNAVINLGALIGLVIGVINIFV